MTAVSAAPARPQVSAITAALIIAIPIVLVLVFLAARLDIIALSHSVRALLLSVQ